MLQLSNAMSVPQIFFGNKHVGGASHLLSKLSSSNIVDSDSSLMLDISSQEMQSWFEQNIGIDDGGNFNLDPRLLPPTTPIVAEVIPPARDFEGIDYIGVACDLEDEFRFQGKTTFSRVELEKAAGEVNVRVPGEYRRSPQHNTTQHTVQLTCPPPPPLLELLDIYKIVRSVTTKPSQSLSPSPSEFVLQSQFSQNALNTFRVWDTETLGSWGAENPIALTHHLKKLLDRICDENRVSGGSAVDYRAARQSDLFKVFDERICELQTINLLSMNQTTKLAFFVNLYNILIKHAFCKIGIPFVNGPNITNPTGGNGTIIPSFFDKIGYEIDGMFFTFDGIENGVLRGNRGKVFTTADDRRLTIAFPESTVDIRIHMAVNCGASSCPPIKKFTTDAIDEELGIVAMAYTEGDGNCLADEENSILRLNMIFKWYRVDFGTDDESVARTVMGLMGEGDKKKKLGRMIDKGGVKIEYFPYNWESDSAEPTVVFDYDKLNTVVY